MTGLSPCAEMVRRHDRDRYLCALFAPADRREDLFALYAFNLEIAKTREVVREPMLGQIRLQWWRETIAGIYAGQPRRHEVVQPLAQAIRRHDLARQDMDALIDAREADLRTEPVETLADLEAYAEATSAGLNRIALTILGAGGDPGGTAGRYVGIAWALTGLIRAVPSQLGQQRLFLPREICEQYGVTVDDLMNKVNAASAFRALAAIADLARAHLTAGRDPGGPIEPAARPVLLAATLADRYLARLARAGYDVFRPGAVAPLRLAPLHLAVSAWHGRY
ncbi:MAG: squalene/phytoene synthase family protein [Alphaproteobacteria bacterium]|nr:squalene/phytoene synthase family protein [Alphaproteobacteria bacterium]